MLALRVFALSMTNSVASTRLLRTIESAIPNTGGPSIMMWSNCDDSGLKSLVKFELDSNSAGLGGSGPEEMKYRFGNSVVLVTASGSMSLDNKFERP